MLFIFVQQLCMDTFIPILVPYCAAQFSGLLLHFAPKVRMLLWFSLLRKRSFFFFFFLFLVYFLDAENLGWKCCCLLASLFLFLRSKKPEWILMSLIAQAVDQNCPLTDSCNWFLLRSFLAKFLPRLKHCAKNMEKPKGLGLLPNLLDISSLGN